jgi:hypothetical protein
MFVGHFGIAEIGKGARRDLSFGWLIVAAYLPDLARLALAPFTDQIDMVSHSILSVALLAMAIAGLWMVRGGNAKGACVLAASCLLHWPADMFTGCKPTIPGGPWIGFVNYRRPLSDITLELALLTGGWVLCRRSGAAIRGWWIALLVAAQLGFLVTMYYGSELLIGDREWIWRPRENIVPQPHVLETLSCRPPEKSR